MHKIRLMTLALLSVCLISFAVACGGETPRIVGAMEERSAEEARKDRALVDKDIEIANLKTEVKKLEAEIESLKAQLQ